MQCNSRIWNVVVKLPIWGITSTKEVDILDLQMFARILCLTNKVKTQHMYLPTCCGALSFHCWCFDPVGIDTVHEIGSIWLKQQQQKNDVALRDWEAIDHMPEVRRFSSYICQILEMLQLHSWSHMGVNFLTIVGAEGGREEGKAAFLLKLKAF